MSAFLQRFSLPLLAKDLVETANRRRTYVLRVVYAVLLYFFSWLFYVEETNAFRRPALDLLGTGRNILIPAILLQFAGICLFMPAMSVGAITIEKERHTLTLLFLTRLGPWTILFEKYLARVVNMVGYLLISLPLLGLAYSLGGVSQIAVWAGIWMLLMMAAQVGSIAILCSAFFHSTTAAFIWTYLIGTGLYFVPAIFVGFLERPFAMDLARDLQNGVNAVAIYWHSAFLAITLPLLEWMGTSPEQIASWKMFQPIDLAFSSDMFMWTCPINIFVASVNPGGVSTAAPWHLFARSIPILMTIALNLLLARFWLVRRAVPSGGNRIMSILRWVDQFFHRINQNRFTRGKVLIQDSQLLPEAEPIAWRETKKRAFGTVRYLVRFLLLIEFPTAVFCILIVMMSVNYSSYRNRHELLAVMSMFLWGLSVLFLISKAATVLPSERLKETFEVLLSTPLSSREIVRQKYAGVARLIWVLSIPLFTVILAHVSFITTSSITTWDPRGVGWYFLGMAGITLIYPRMVAWLSILVGLKIKSQTKAIFITLSILLAWIVLPIVGLFIWDEVLDMPLPMQNPLSTFAFCQSPAFPIGILETSEEPEAIGVTVFVTLIEYSAIAVCLRMICLNNAARLLGRPETDSQ